MKAYTLEVICLCALGIGFGETITFDCFKDRCERGTQYCVTDRKRCYNCADMKSHCDTSVMPRDCDGYCKGLIVENLESRLNATLEEAIVLQDTVRRLNTVLDNSTKRVDQAKSENNEIVKEAQAQTEMIEITLAESRKNNTFLKTLFQGCDKDTSVGIIIGAVATTLCVVLLGGLLLLLGLRKKRILYWKIALVTSNPDEEPKLSVSSEETGEETSVLIPVNITDKTDRTSRASSADSAVVIISDDTSNVTNNSQDTQPTDVDSGAESEVRATPDDNCLRKDVPVALKGIAPTTTAVTDSSQHCYNN